MTSLTVRATMALEAQKTQKQLDDEAATVRQRVELQRLARVWALGALGAEIDEFYDLERITRYGSSIEFRVDNLTMLISVHNGADPQFAVLTSRDEAVKRALLGFGDKRRFIDLTSLGKALAHCEKAGVDPTVKP